jgi:hypothetical protein
VGLAPPAAAGCGAGAEPPAGCAIKGNISRDGGERIYHVPGQRYYGHTRISPEHGERWFCSEAEARAAGWRRAER